MEQKLMEHVSDNVVGFPKHSKTASPAPYVSSYKEDEARSQAKHVLKRFEGAYEEYFKPYAVKVKGVAGPHDAQGPQSYRNIADPDNTKCGSI